jgi:SNF2 family DNA or RNA helicase
MLRQPHLRFLLADDAGAGKTIMAGLYIREMLSRRLLRRVLIVPPAGLVGNWRRELLTLFNLPFRIISGADARDGNPFIGEDSDRLIAKLDTLAGDKMFARLRDPNVTPYDLVIFDEAHKLSTDRGNDMRVRKTDRYRLAEALAGAPDLDHGWRLPWHAQHLLLLTATPHMGRDYPYYALWRLLDPQVLSTPEAFKAYPPEHRRCHFIRRTKEEMVKLDGKPLYPTRISDTHGYDLSQGKVSEQTLYDETTDYLRHVYNRAKLLNRSAARLAMSVFQRRLASSTYALFRSLERRMEKLQALIQEVQQGRLTMEQLTLLQRQIAEQGEDAFDSKTADEENPKGQAEENETDEDRLMQGVVAASLVELCDELKQVTDLRDLAEEVYQAGTDSKYEKLRDLLTAPEYANEKFIVFTEHRDTLTFLVRSLEGMGYTGQVAQIHGGMDYPEREEQVEHFRTPASDGGARFLIATDAAGEGINLQFCWIMINYDIPWNNARANPSATRRPAANPCRSLTASTDSCTSGAQATSTRLTSSWTNTACAATSCSSTCSSPSSNSPRPAARSAPCSKASAITWASKARSKTTNKSCSQLQNDTNPDFRLKPEEHYGQATLETVARSRNTPARPRIR